SAPNPKVARTGEILLSPTRMPIRGYVTFLSEILVTDTGHGQGRERRQDKDRRAVLKKKSPDSWSGQGLVKQRITKVSCNARRKYRQLLAVP
ncbi:hypothetical protein, partial [Burkholderia ubonensis]|uniref:hypothetical protein n=1 Tax=Burkholderia ubonensis TaxID=101571 RepID=UPI001E6550BD